MWIIVDGQRVFSFDHYPFERAEAEAYYDGLGTEQVKESLRRSEIHSPTDFGDAMREYLDAPINQALESSNPVIKAFALVDRRTGRRAIDKMQLTEFEHSLVKAFYELRKSTVDHETVSK